MKKYLTLIVVFLCLAVAIVIEGQVIRNLRNQRDAYRGNMETLMEEVDTFRTRNNDLVAKVSSLQLTKKEYESLMDKDAKEIKALKNRNEYLEHAIKTNVETEVKIETVVKDSIVYRDRVDTVRYFHWEDMPWEYIHGEMDGDNITLDMYHHEELDVNVFLEYKKFLWWKIKLKGYNVDVVGKNPYTKDIDVSSVTIR